MPGKYGIYFRCIRRSCAMRRFAAALPFFKRPPERARLRFVPARLRVREPAVRVARRLLVVPDERERVARENSVACAAVTSPTIERTPFLSAIGHLT